MDVTTTLSELSQGAKVTLFGAGLTVVGAVLPWAAGLERTISGLEGGGTTAIFVAVVAAALAVLQRNELLTRGAVFLLGFVVALLGAVAYANPGSLAGMVRPAVGVYVTMGGGLAVMLGAVLGYSAGTHDDQTESSGDDPGTPEPAD